MINGGARRIPARTTAWTFADPEATNARDFRRVVELAIKSESGDEANGPRAFLARRLSLALAIPIGVLLVLGAVLGRQILQMSEDSNWVEHTDQVRGAATEAMLEIIDQEARRLEMERRRHVAAGLVVDPTAYGVSVVSRATPCMPFASSSWTSRWVSAVALPPKKASE